MLIEDDSRRQIRRNSSEEMFCGLKGWQRIAERSAVCPKQLFSTLVLVKTVIFWLCSAKGPGLKED